MIQKQRGQERGGVDRPMAPLDEPLIQMADYLDGKVFKRELLPQIPLPPQGSPLDKLSEPAKSLLGKSVTTIDGKLEYVSVEPALQEIKQALGLRRVLSTEDVEEAPSTLVKPPEPSVRKHTTILEVLDQYHE